MEKETIIIEKCSCETPAFPRFPFGGSNPTCFICNKPWQEQTFTITSFTDDEIRERMSKGISEYLKKYPL